MRMRPPVKCIKIPQFECTHVVPSRRFGSLPYDQSDIQNEYLGTSVKQKVCTIIVDLPGNFSLYKPLNGA